MAAVNSFPELTEGIEESEEISRAELAGERAPTSGEGGTTAGTAKAEEACRASEAVAALTNEEDVGASLLPEL